MIRLVGGHSRHLVASAKGKDVSYPASVRATSPRTCKGGVRVYNKLTVSFTHRKPSVSGSLKHWTPGCPT